MTRNQIVWALFLVLIIPVLVACEQSGFVLEITPEVTIQQLSEPALKPLTVLASGNDEPTRSANMPVVLSDEAGHGQSTATPTASFFTLVPSLTPTGSPTDDGTITLTPTNTPLPGVPTETPSVTATTGINTTTPTASDTPQGTAAPTSTPTFEPTATPTNTAQPGATGTPTPTVTSESSSTPTPTQSTQHFTNCAFRTGGNAVIAFTSEVVISGGLTFDIGDEIAVFTPDGTICAGVELKDKPNIAITAWGDDSQTAEVDGLRAGETMFYRIWDTSAGIEYKVISSTYAVGPGLGSGKYSPDSIHSLTAITVSSS